ncbi:universal stress protein [Pleionea sp. CnH1-48]|uniref:universal stress protein n=1 Tax=Pleionea sp. CnH1-48 TaxID=2954494 RepID=UPI002097280F|nr:universal stress protein [Pleionea sp. CnH1-48]MCO7224727.1 universal stress protein [Pleionea sp. CnH1-48]
MFKTILCAIEASDEGKEVLSHASQLSKLCDAQLLVVHVIPYALLPKDYQKELEEEAKPKIREIASEFDISEKCQFIKVGKPYQHICSLAEKKNADLIILGTHSQKGVQALLGSTANAVVNKATCNVSLVKV